jgi:hypothetical protein
MHVRSVANQFREKEGSDMFMRRLLAPLILTTSLLILLAPTAIAAGTDPFKGSWSAIDGDGSRLSVSFSGNGATRTVTLFDDRATCLGGDSMIVSGSGTISGNTISGSWHLPAQCGGEAPFQWTYDPTVGTLFDGFVTWYRGDRGPDAFNGVWIATDFDGSSLRLALDGSGLSRDVSFFDDGASVCGPVIDGEGINWSGEGTGVIGSTLGFGRFIDVTLSGSCAGSPHEPIDPQTYEYDYVNNQLIGPLGITWSRK